MISDTEKFFRLFNMLNISLHSLLALFLRRSQMFSYLCSSLGTVCFMCLAFFFLQDFLLILGFLQLNMIYLGVAYLAFILLGIVCASSICDLVPENNLEKLAFIIASSISFLPIVHSPLTVVTLNTFYTFCSDSSSLNILSLFSVFAFKFCKFLLICSQPQRVFPCLM